jgi:hypothetical protein
MKEMLQEYTGNKLHFKNPNSQIPSRPCGTKSQTLCLNGAGYGKGEKKIEKRKEEVNDIGKKCGRTGNNQIANLNYHPACLGK